MTSHLAPEAVDFLDRTRFPAREWALTETRPCHRDDMTDLGKIETIFALGNGYLGLRGNVPEGRDSFEHGTFVNGLHETWPIQHAEEAYGFAKVGQTIVNAPDAKVIRLYVDDEPLLVSVADLTEYDRTLDFQSGQLRRELIWRTPSGKRVRVTTTRLVSFVERHLAMMTFEVELLDEAAPVAISSQILNRQDGEDEYHVAAKAMGEGFDPRKSAGLSQRVLEPKYRDGDVDTGRVVLGYRVAQSGMTVATSAHHEFHTENDHTAHVHLDDDLAKMSYRIAAQPGQPIRLTKYVAYHSSRGVPARELVDRCNRTLDRALERGREGVEADQRAWLDGFWHRSDVEIPDQPEVQQAVRWNLFQLAQASIRAEGTGIAAKGVTGSGYNGHYFWDGEIYVLPFLTYTNPSIARNALRFRHQLLHAARRRAREVSQSGALFPWRTINGEEASAYYAAGTAQYHINADVAYALNKYLVATGDQEFLESAGIDILVETARMWVDLGFWRAENDGVFHIHGVTGPDEYTTVVNDNLFTNIMAQFNLARAAQAVRELAERDGVEYDRVLQRLELDESEIEDWESAARDMAIPFDHHMGIHPQDEHFLEREVWDLDKTPLDKRPLLLNYHPLVIYRFQVIKQTDVVLALYLLGHHFTADEKRANFEYYDPITTGDSTLSEVVQSIMAAEVGYRDLAYRYFIGSLFVDLADRHRNTSDGVHVASAGGVWSVLAGGFGGFRDSTGTFCFDPRLPSRWREFSFRLTLRGTLVLVTVRPESIEFEVLDAGEHPVDIEVRGKPYTLDADTPLVVALDGQGPELVGSPLAVPGRRRADGSIIAAIVPGTDRLR